ncbi:MAG TPA: PAS domain S-box protein, partial [Polyangiaceae bacterium]|nr:PAS domain S-box protein [Polyangiaceae bacterium]
MDPKTHTRKPADAFEDQGSGTKDEQFRLAIEAAPTGMLIVDSNGQIALVNSQIEKLFGYERAALVGQPVEMLVPERFRSQHPQYRAHFLARPAFRPMGAGRDLYGLHKNGSEIPIEIGLNPLRTAQGDFVLSSVVDITERKRAEREREELLGQLRALNAELEQRVQLRTEVLSATLREREVLLQEVHHRVKNVSVRSIALLTRARFSAVQASSAGTDRVRGVGSPLAWRPRLSSRRERV